MMWIALYFLIGAIVAVWTAINEQRMRPAGAGEELPGGGELLAAYVLIALAWPLSLAVFAYAVLSQLLSGEPNG